MGKDTSGKRRQITRSSFPSKVAAKHALQEQLAILMADVSATDLTVSEYLETWLMGKKALRPKTVALCPYAINS